MMMIRVLLFALATAHAQTTATTTAQINTTPKPVVTDDAVLKLEYCGFIWGKGFFKSDMEKPLCLYLAFKDIFFLYVLVFALIALVCRIASNYCSCSGSAQQIQKNMYSYLLRENFSWFFGNSCCQSSDLMTEVFAFLGVIVAAAIAPEIIFLSRVYSTIMLMNTEAPQDARRSEKAQLLPTPANNATDTSATGGMTSRFNDPIRPRIQFPSLKRQMNVAEP